MPNLALIPRLKAFDEIHYIGSVGGMEEGLVREKRAPSRLSQHTLREIRALVIAEKSCHSFRAYQKRERGKRNS